MAGLLELFEPYFTASDNIVPSPGDLFLVPTPEYEEIPRILDVHRNGPTEHDAVTFSIVEYSPRVHYRSRERLPIHRLNLGDTQELLISRSKCRPCVVMASSVIDTTAISELGRQGERLAKHLTKTKHLVAPTYGVATMDRPNAYLPKLVDRIDRLEYPHLACLPDQNDHSPYQARSIVRLDHTFPSHLGRGIQPLGIRLADEPWAVLQEQFKVMLGKEPSEQLLELIALFSDT